MSLLTRYWGEIQVAAAQHSLDPLLVEAIVVQESNGNADAFRFEPVFWNRLLKPKAQWAGKNPRRVSSSYSLMQCMYVVALERGYPVTDPPEGLFVPEVGLEYGCRQLRYLLDWAATFEAPEAARVLSALAAYNGGKGGNKPTETLRNGVYARSVQKYYTLLKTEHAF